MSLYDGWTTEEVAKHEATLLRQQRGFPPDLVPSAGRYVRWRLTLSCGHVVRSVRSDWRSQPTRAECGEHGRRDVKEATRVV